MKATIIVLLFAALIGVNAQAQSLADVARAERQRQAALKSVETFEKAGARAPVERQTPAQPTEEEKGETEEEPTLEEKLQNERANLIRERSALLVRLDQVKDDPEAARSIEEQLIALTKRAEDLKLQHLESEAESQ